MVYAIDANEVHWGLPYTYIVVDVSPCIWWLELSIDKIKCFSYHYVPTEQKQPDQAD